ncbi:ABC transporter ATP-binding protein [Aneurinibacillus migulanus]|uniref:Nickel transport system ATP-binding protein n=1 Tax=Aneurinibacillus migulanus TaxID=47500 RepID=A0A0D1UUJ1_ANEMI|nr:ABC transporter ATP-binding protein [Aneurinibacillus migulanus]KIV50639.1 peptide ABC transporter ATP-binding protein [Aneurinibacillus migulanus]KON97450.1 peptide ABC transporter ATP-binding protein [Aneurinibacillus migulanus]MED0896119.1 ABC transporter ATP-binding protein [Aneurinibacillus migulanus]MED1618547.1 ABC transporter ATP-binding protein [Aneurinibacillus migulanus]SDK50145.1 nickel transport system ATP-binding protein [Aneurinibacillus migulanus]
MLSVDRVEKSYNKGGLFSRERQTVLKNISFEWGQGECLGIIGESGSGKSTLGRLLLGIEKPDQGTILFRGKRIEDRRVRLGNISAVFQDYTSSINPFYTVEEAILEPLTLQRKVQQDIKGKIDDLLYQVGLNSSYRKKYPHELSGGEIQRVCIARAVSTEPKCVLLDEAISSLDSSVQIQVLELLINLREFYNMGYIFITHDIQAAAYICDRMMIIRNGQIEEMVKIEQLKDVQSAYARKLLQMIIA